MALSRGRQAGSGRRSHLQGDDDAADEVDAGKSARKERRDARRAARTPVVNFEVSEPVYYEQVINGEQVFTSQVTLSPDVEQPGLLERMAARRGADKDRRRGRGGPLERARGWWDRTFPEGRSGWGGRMLDAFGGWRAGQNATLLNFGADNVEATPGLLRATGQPLAARGADWLMERTRAPERLRDAAVAEYRHGLEQNELATELGARVAFSGVIVASALMPIPGLGGGPGAAADDAVRLAAQTGDELVQAGAAALARSGDEAVGAAARLPELASPPATPTAYSTAIEVRLHPTSYPGASRARRFQEANELLLRAMESDPAYAAEMRAMGISLERGVTGRAPRTPPPGWTWHHEIEAGVMRLVPRTQHTPGSSFWGVLHPDGRGGYAIWGKESTP